MPQNPDVALALADQKARLPYIAKRRRYYEGHHDTVIPDAGSVRNDALRQMLLVLSDNMCDDVVDETVDRLEVLAWSSTGLDTVVKADDEQGPVDDVLGEQAQQMWDDNRGPAREPRTYREALWAGDSWSIVEVQPATHNLPERVYDYPQMPEQMGCQYREDRPDTIRVAWKVWKSGTAWRLNLYYGADNGDGIARLERWGTAGSTNDGGIPSAQAFKPLPAAEPVEGEAVDDGLRPTWYRNPVFHYPNGEVGQYGRSVLSDVIPLQDVLNKALQDLVVKGEDIALPQRWGTGIQAAFDAVTGEQTPVRRSSKRATDLLTTASKDATFGQFDGADLTQSLAVISGLRAEIARKGYLPSWSTGDGSTAAGTSGLQMLVAEGRQVKRCKACQRDWGTVHAEKMAFMLTLAGGKVDPTDLEPQWAEPATRDEQAQWELLSLKMALGVPKERLLVEGGYTPEQAQQWTEQSAASAGGRLSGAQGLTEADMAGGVASITQVGVPGGIGLPNAGTPQQPAGAAAPGVPGA